MGKILVIVYSYTGTCERLARRLCDQQGWPLGRVTDARPRRGAVGTLRCVLDSWLRRRPPIYYRGPSPADFDAVVLIAPIWMYRLAGPMRSFVASHRGMLADLFVAPVMGRRGAANAIAEVGRIAGRPPVLGTAFTAREVDDGSCTARLRAFAEGVRLAEADTPPARPATWSPRAA